ncbi:hypothetical protein HW561_20940 [Rhodobacteraceae bacterium B1Z28]|uniref:LysM domain-containing protein n=1 Tax=Ruegeria haliotis TaxID=2747601 RepID=A0ABX2PVU2_9RHOB|nr:hypothetical protein [Ruegeria haliotis]NVO58256.1 hypothetical protein [Ruegeria haliotis]
MPIGIARVGREKSIATLARNLYRLDDATPADLRRVERELLKANPDLKRKESFVPGRILIVPGIRGIRPSDRVEAQSTDLAGLLGDAAARLALGAQLAAKGVSTAEVEIKDGLAQLNDASFRKVAKAALPESPKLIQATVNGLEKENEALTSRARDLTRAFAEAQEKVTELSRVIRNVKPGPDG